MAPRPSDNDTYPAEPLPQWFMNAPSNMHSIQSDAWIEADRSPVSSSSYYNKMGETEWKAYMAAHSSWRVACLSIDAQHHAAKLLRLAQEKVTQKPSGRHRQTNRDPWESADIPTVSVVTHLTTGKEYEILEEKKIPHAPTLSKKPFKAEKRAAKKQLVKNREEVKVEVLKAKSVVLRNDVTPASIQEQIRSIRKITDQAPLQRAEATAIKSAAARAKGLKFLSPDSVVNVAPHDGFKLVTRAKGSRPILLATATRTDEGATVTLTADPSLVSTSRTVQSAVRVPNISERFMQR